jgi:hypothetical protein
MTDSPFAQPTFLVEVEDFTLLILIVGYSPFNGFYLRDLDDDVERGKL